MCELVSLISSYVSDVVDMFKLNGNANVGS